jgi:hypothetical protein
MFARVSATVALAWLAAAAAADPPLPGDDAPPSRRSQALLWKEAMRLAKKGGPAAEKSEAARMLAALLKGDRVAGGGGWFGPGQSRYGWQWLARRLDPDGEGRITRAKFTGPAELFDRLDRDGSGAITADDFDWSEKSPFVKQQTQAAQLFRSIDADGDGRVTAEEWENYFARLAKEKEFLAPDDLRAALFPSPRRGDRGKGDKAKDEKTKKLMLQAFLDGDAGSPFEGPRVGQDAPDFTLPTYDGKGTIGLSDFRGKKPVVLIFGSFT